MVYSGAVAARAYAFLFDGSVAGLPDPQLPFFTAALLSALSRADRQGRSHAQVRVGLPSLTRFAERTTAVSGTSNSSGRTISHDIDIYKKIDLAAPGAAHLTGTRQGQREKLQGG